MSKYEINKMKSSIYRISYKGIPNTINLINRKSSVKYRTLDKVQKLNNINYYEILIGFTATGTSIGLVRS